MRTARPSPRENRGMASVAVLVFSIVAVLILVANFRLNYAVSVSGDAFDTFNSQTVEKNGIAQIVKESILAVRETATVNSTDSIQAEIQNRLSSLNFPAGVSVTLVAAPAVPPHPFFPWVAPFVPSVAPLATAQPVYFPADSSAPRGIAGMGGLLASLVIQGPVTDLGRLSYTFGRASSQAPGEDCTYTVNADLFSVPLTNVNVVAYGLPASGSIPAQSPAVPPGTFGTGVSTLVVTSNDPANDPTAYPDLFAPATPEQLPYQFRNQASYAWNAYEFLWNRTYQDALIAAAQSEADPGNTPTPAPTVEDPDPMPNPTGAVYDLSSANNPTIAGFSVAGNAITIDCGAVQSPVVVVVDSLGIGSVTITGSPIPGAPFVLLIRNTDVQPSGPQITQTHVTFAGTNVRPAIFYLENADVGFSGSPQFAGALFLDPTTVAAGSVTWFGHFSFYGPANPFGTLAIAVHDDASVKSALAAIAPRVLLVSTSATRQ